MKSAIVLLFAAAVSAVLVGSAQQAMYATKDVVQQMHAMEDYDASFLETAEKQAAAEEKDNNEESSLILDHDDNLLGENTLFVSAETQEYLDAFPAATDAEHQVLQDQY